MDMKMESTGGINLSESKQYKEIVYASFVLHKNGLRAVGEPSFDEWLQCGEFINRAKDSVHFWIGDWLNFGEFKWGEKYLEAVKASGYDIGTLRNDKWVADKVDLSRRRDTLSFDHHATVADLEPEEQDKLLSDAEAKKLNSKAFRSYVQQGQPHPQPLSKVSSADVTWDIISINEQLLKVLNGWDFEAMDSEDRDGLLNQLKQTADLINNLFKEWTRVAQNSTSNTIPTA